MTELALKLDDSTLAPGDCHQVSEAMLQQMDHRYRATLINSISGYKSANLIGTVDAAGQTNVSIISSCVHLGADPALIGLVIRPHSVDRHSLENLLSTGYYTINHVHIDMVEAAHQTSARYDKTASEFEATGLSEQWLEDFTAPFVAESRLKFGVRFRQHIPLEINGTEFIIGEICRIILPGGVVNADGYLDLEAAGTATVTGLDSYHRGQRLARYSYAKTDRPLSKIDVPTSASKD
ncbi:flavin reductase family protein [Allohahella sp. A8]|uniref:flavin reductase family protein n=1 Tax=Allohahella sp. A8 TaxID=3141461 RepID=UPI0026D7B06C|tara:strand:- start:9942 stop:10652 length:711 start_codon:yes stop_codon:yes gene_type:complete